MARTSLIFRNLRCLACSHTSRYQFWTRRSLPSGRTFEPSFSQLHCVSCNAPAPQLIDADAHSRCNVFPTLRSESRPVVFRWRDDSGREHIRYPARNDDAQRPSEERVEFPTLRSLEAFLKEENAGKWNQDVSLNDILDYDNPDTAISDSDDSATEEMAQLLSSDDAGVLDSAPDERDVKFSIGELTTRGN